MDWQEIRGKGHETSVGEPAFAVYCWRCGAIWRRVGDGYLPLNVPARQEKCIQKYPLRIKDEKELR